MLSVLEVRRWIDTLGNDCNIAICKKGLTLVKVDPTTGVKDAYLEVGGIPDTSDDKRPVLDDKWFQEADAFQGDTLVNKGQPWVDPDDAPPLGKDFFDNAEIRQGDIVIRERRSSDRSMTRTHTPVDDYPFQKRDASTLTTLDEFLDEDGIREEVTQAAKEMTLVRVFESDGHSHLTSCRKDEDMSAFVAAREDVVKVETTEGQQLWPLPPENTDGSETNDPGNTKSN